MTTARTAMNRALGARMKDLRRQAAARQDDVARAAWNEGLDWTQATVAAYEAGTRAFTLDVLAVLPQMFSRLLGREFALRELFPNELPVSERLRLPRDQLAERLCTPARPLTVTMLAGRPPHDDYAAHPPFAVDDLCAQYDDVWPDVTPERLRKAAEQVLEKPPGDAERKLAHRMKLRRPMDVRMAAHLTWGCSLTEKRDATLREQEPQGASEGSRAALLGYITRKLQDELEPLLRQAPRRD